MAALALLLGVLVGSTAMGSRAAAPSASRTATIAVVTTSDFRVAVIARRLSGAKPPTADVRVGLARRVDGSWREFAERRLGETYFWYTVSRARAICRVAIETVGTRRHAQLLVTVQLLLSPSLGCGRTHRLPLSVR